MSALIRAEVQEGLAQAAAELKGANDDPINLVKRAAGGTLIAPTATETKTELINAIFTALDTNIFNGEIKSVDRQLVSDHEVHVEIGDLIEQGSKRYLVVDQDVKAPLTEVLVYISHVRLQ